MTFSNTQQNQIEKACQQFQVKRLYVFGSATTGKLTPDSDLDFLVDFKRNSPKGAFDQFTGFKEALESIFNRPVDLITVKQFRNPEFQEEVNNHSVLVYAA